MALEIGQVVDRYHIEALIGEGACGVVYRVRHAQLGSQHALKVLHKSTGAMQTRLSQEGQIQAGLRHPNIVPVTDIIDLNGTPALVAEYIDGPDLEEWCRQHEPDAETAEAIFRQILSGLTHAHSRGIIHRDLKPSNILMDTVDDRPIPRITDFGIAKVLNERGPNLTRSQASMGSPRYMAPEQWRNSKDVDARADIFSMGCILYELVCGQPTFVADNLPDIFQSAAAARYTDPGELCPGLKPALRIAIIRCLHPSPTQRPADCAAVLVALDETDPIEPPSPAEREGAKQTLMPDPNQAADETLAPLDEDIDLLEHAQPETPHSRRTSWLAAGSLGLFGLLVLARFAMPTQHIEPVVQAQVIPPSEEIEPEVTAASLMLPADVLQAPSPAPAEDISSEPPSEPVESQSSLALIGAEGSNEVWLTQGDRRFELGEVPAGRYQIQAVFSGETIHAGDVSLRAGEQVKLKCEEYFQQCRRKEP